MKETDALRYTTPFGIAAQVVIRALFRQMLDNLPGTRAGDDIEALHDMRVASRRLRAALRVFRACLPAPSRKPVEDGIRDITRALGDVRDRDVFIDYLETYQSALAFPPDKGGSSGVKTREGEAPGEPRREGDGPPSPPPTNPRREVQWVIDAERKSRDQARVRMLAALDAFESGSVAADIETMLCQVRMIRLVGRGARTDQFGRQASRLVDPRLDELVSFDSVVDHPEDALGLHAMRIAAKRLRYTMEAFGPCFGKELSSAISEIKALQEQLGAIHDCDVWVEKLRTYAQRPRLSLRRRALVDDVIRDRLRARNDTYLKAYLHWNDLRSRKFPRELSKLLSSRPSPVGVDEASDGAGSDYTVTPA